MAELSDLPAELIPGIFPYLSDEDVLAARQTSRYICAASLKYFGRRFFRKKGFLITTTSLNVLKSIAAHDEFKKHVQHVWFNPDLYERWTYISELSPDDAQYGNREAELFSRPKYARIRKQEFLECIADHQDLLHREHPRINGSSILELMLVSAFAGLPNLKVMGMRRGQDHAPWGWRRLEQAVGMDPRVIGPLLIGPRRMLSDGTELFLAIINAVAATSLRIERLYTDAIEIDNFQPCFLSKNKLKQALRSLLYLEINAIKGNLSTEGEFRYRVLDSKSDYGTGLMKVLRAAPNLREIGLQIFSETNSWMRTPVLHLPVSWRHSYQYLAFRHAVSYTRFTMLTRVKVEKLQTKPSYLHAFLEPAHASLTSVKIRDLRLLSFGETQERCWEPIFSFLHKSCPNLDHILFYHLMHDEGGVSFEETPPPPSPSPELNMYSAPELFRPSGSQTFVRYDNLVATASGKEKVKEKLGEIIEGHWYYRPMYSYAMDEDLWHTDTSDEED